MSIFVIADLHLSFGVNKPMDIFGNNWKNHEKKIRDNWIKKVKKEEAEAQKKAEKESRQGMSTPSMPSIQMPSIQKNVAR